MSEERKVVMERFLVSGNVLKLTPRFDPRYQSRVGMELMNIVSGLALEKENAEVVLDISDAEALPSMMIGILYEASDLTGKAGKKLRIRLKQTTYDRLQSLGLGSVFTPAGTDAESGGVEILAESQGSNKKE